MRPPLSMMPALPVAAGLAAGIALSAAAPVWAVGSLAAAAAAYGLATGKHFAAYVSLMALIGALLWHFSSPAPLPPIMLQRNCSIQGTVVMAEMKDYGYAAVVMADRIDDADIEPVRCYAQLRDFLPSAPQRGSRVALRGKVSAIPDEPDVPGDAYHPSWLLRAGIKHRIHYEPATWRVLEPASGIDAVANAMHRCMFRAIANSPVSGSTAAFLIAAMLGNDYFLDDSTLLAYRESGIAHVLALSGMHVATLAALVMLLLVPFRLIRRGYIYSRVLLLALVWLYALATGMSPSVVRASVMLSAVIVSGILQRESSPLNALCLAAATILAFSPHALFSPGFQMSFCAVISILLANHMLPARLQRARHTYALASVLLLPLAAMAGTGLLCAYHFHIFPWSFVIGNVLMAFAFPLLLGSGFVLMLFSLAGWHCAPLGKLLDFVYEVTNRCIQGIAGCFHALSVPDFSAWVFVPYACALAFLALAVYRRRAGMPCRSAFAVAACWLAATVATAGCMRQQPLRHAAYLTSGTFPMMLVCQPGAASVLPLSLSAGDTAMLAKTMRRFEPTARMHGADSVAMMPHAYSHGACRRAGSRVDIGQSSLQIFGEGQAQPAARAHYAIVTRQYGGSISDIVKACQPDTIVLTGDIAPSRRAKLTKECADSVPCIDLFARALRITM